MIQGLTPQPAPGPLRLDPIPGKRHGCLLLIAAIYNGLTLAAMPKNHAELGYWLIFAPGALIALTALWQALKWFAPRLDIELDQGRLRLSERTTLRWHWRSGQHALTNVAIRLVCRETACFRNSSESRTDVHDDPRLTIHESVGAEQDGTVELALPANGLPSFIGEDNQVSWVIQVTAKLPWRPKVLREFALVIAPPPMGERTDPLPVPADGDITLIGGRRDLRPGDRVAGTARWPALAKAADLHVRLQWVTGGIGGVDMEVLGRQDIGMREAAGQVDFDFAIPADAPPGFNGKLISLGYFVVLSGTGERRILPLRVGPCGVELKPTP